MIDNKTLILVRSLKIGVQIKNVEKKINKIIQIFKYLELDKKKYFLEYKKKAFRKLDSYASGYFLNLSLPR